MSVFKTRWLKELKKEGHLKIFSKKFSKKINSKTFMSAGTQVECYKSPSGKLIKVCPKQIKFYKYWNDFATEINQLNQFFMPVDSIIYEDEYIIVYVQERCKKMYKLGRKSPYVGLNILLLIIAMFKNNKIATDIGANNVGVFEDGIYLFDCHGLMNDNPEVNYFRLAKNLYRYLKSYYYCLPEDLLNILTDKDTRIENLIKKYFEPIYRTHINEFTHTQKEILLSKIGTLNI